MFGKKCGFSNFLLFQCGKCNWKASFYTSLPLEKTNKEVRSPGQVGFDINSRIVLSFREIGKGYQAISDFAMHMHITPPFSKGNYYAISDKLHKAYVDAAKTSMQSALGEIRNDVACDDNNIGKCAVSVDGTWQKRGHAMVSLQLLGKITKNAQTMVFSKNCNGCKMLEKKK